MRDISHFACLAVFFLSVAGCHSNDDDTTPTEDAGEPDSTGDEVVEDAGPTPEIFAHDSTTLYRFDPIEHSLAVVGRFTCADQVVADIAINAAGEMFGTTSTSLVYIDKTTAECIEIARGAYPTSLGFVPAGTLDPNEDALVGFNFAQYVRIDTNTGAMTFAGSLNPNDAGVRFDVSGDVVSASGGKTYVSVKIAGAQDNGDFVVEIDPKTGRVINIISSTKKRNLWGLGYWAGEVYGFNTAGDVFAVDIDGGKTHLLALHDGGGIPATPVADAGSDADAGVTGGGVIEFVGAAVTTLAPP